MKINHLIVGANDVEKSTEFYCELFGFEVVTEDPGAEGGRVLRGRDSDLLIAPFDDKIPNPAHFAFEARSMGEFEVILARAENLGLSPRAEPAMHSKRGAGKFERNGKVFYNFYVSDPSGSNVELMVFI